MSRKVVLPIVVAVIVFGCLSFAAEFGSQYNKRTIGGTEARPGEFPFLVSISNADYNHWCGGSIIDDRHVVTAAHCVASEVHPTPSTINVGCHKYNQCKQIQVENFTIHEDYSKHSLINDIALIRTKKPIPFNRIIGSGAIRPIRLQTHHLDYDDNEPLSHVGWGLTSCEPDSVSKVPIKVVVPALSMRRCRRLIAERTGYSVFRQNVCAGSVEKHAGKGDSGGPLVEIRRDGSSLLVGISSWTASNTTHCSAWTSVYTRVSSHIEWLNEAKMSLAWRHD